MFHASISLRWKILAWFFINLAVAGLLACIFLLVQFRIGMSSLIAGSTDDRLEAIAQPLAANLHRLPFVQWDAALDRAVAVWRARGLEVSLFRDNGEFVAGDIKALPPEVRKEMDRHDAQQRHGPPMRRGGYPPWRRAGGSGDRANFVPPPARAPAESNLAGEPEPPGTGEYRPGPGPSRPPNLSDEDRDGPGWSPPRDDAPLVGSRLDKFMLVAGTPRLYWTGVYLGEVQRPTRGGPVPSVVLVLASTSLSAGGLFFDYKPWLVLGSALVLISILWWLPFVHGLTRSLTRMTAVAEEIARGQFPVSRPSRRRDELGRLGRALSHMSARLEGHVTGQKRFLGDTAHELLSPLARLEVALSILEHQTRPEGDRRYVERSLEEVRQMSRLVNDLLAYTKAGLRAQTATLRPVAAAEIARQAIGREAAEGEVTVDVPEDCWVRADPELLVRALANGVRNALRYAKQGGPISIVAAPAAHPASGEIDISIVDHGPGVPPSAIDQLFDPFFRPEDARTRETGGTGLGLAIVKSCVEACDGQVSVQNRTPHGLELKFRLKQAAAGSKPSTGVQKSEMATAASETEASRIA